MRSEEVFKLKQYGWNLKVEVHEISDNFAS